MGRNLDKLRDINGAILRKSNLNKSTNVSITQEVNRIFDELLSRGKAILKEYYRVQPKIDLYTAQVTIDAKKWSKDVDKAYKYIDKKLKELGYDEKREVVPTGKLTWYGMPEHKIIVTTTGEIPSSIKTRFTQLEALEKELLDDSYIEISGAPRKATNVPLRPGQYDGI